jgi:chaperonin GroES
MGWDEWSLDQAGTSKPNRPIDINRSMVKVPNASGVAAAFFSTDSYPWRKTMKVRPLHDRILLKRIVHQEVTRGGIIIPDSAREKPMDATVVAVGKGQVTEDGKLRPLDIKAGDHVLVGKYSGTEIKIEGVEHLIVREDEVLAVVE